MPSRPGGIPYPAIGGPGFGAILGKLTGTAKTGSGAGISATVTSKVRDGKLGLKTQGGLFERSVRCGDRVGAGQVIGRYYDLYGDPAGEATTPHAGVVLAIHAGPVMATGETLIHVGLDPREA